MNTTYNTELLSKLKEQEIELEKELKFIDKILQLYNTGLGYTIIRTRLIKTLGIRHKYFDYDFFRLNEDVGSGYCALFTKQLIKKELEINNLKQQLCLKETLENINKQEVPNMIKGGMFPNDKK